MSEQPSDHKPAKLPLPRLIEGRMGTRLYSIAALIERVVDQFFIEHGDGSEALSEARTRGQRLRLLLDSAEYVLAVESVNVTSDDKAEIVKQAYSEVFGYGPLDVLFADERITTLYLNGARSASVRYAHGEMEAIGPIFEDEIHLTRIVRRLLEDAGAELQHEPGIVETGLEVNGRPVSLTVAMPPYVAHLTADIRLHPLIMPGFEQLVQSEFMTEEAAVLIRQMVDSKYGIAVVGEPESGKTMLMNALLGLIAPAVSAATVERSSELRPPEGVKRLTVKWAASQPVSYSERILEALDMNPQLLVLDELRSDEPQMIAPLLERESLPRMWWSVRAAPDAKRLQSALGMMARRSGPGMDESRVLALYERLPFVLSCARIRGRLQLFSVGEWQSRVDTDYPDLVLLHQYRDGAARSTGSQLARWLDIST